MVMLVVLAACESGGDGSAARRSEPPPPSASEVPLSVHELAVVGDFSVRPAAPDTELSTVSARTLDAGEGSVVVLAIERPGVPGRCIVEALLRLHLEDSSDFVSTELAVYPSHVFDAEDKEDGERFGYSGGLLDVRPRGTHAGATTRWTVWDVADVFRRWVGGSAFPSQGKRAPGRGPVVLALRDVDGEEPFATATISSSESTGNAPHVVLTSNKQCVTGRA